MVEDHFFVKEFVHYLLAGTGYFKPEKCRFDIFFHFGFKNKMITVCIFFYYMINIAQMLPYQFLGNRTFDW